MSVTVRQGTAHTFDVAGTRCSPGQQDERCRAYVQLFTDDSEDTWLAKVESIVSLPCGPLEENVLPGQPEIRAWIEGEAVVALIVRRLIPFTPPRATGPTVVHEHVVLEEAGFWGVTRQEGPLVAVRATQIIRTVGLLPVPADHAHAALPASWVVFPPAIAVVDR